MKISTILLLLSTLSLSHAIDWYPVNSKGEIPADIKPYTKGQDINFDCIQRNIDNGEHKFDEKENIIYGAFPKCKETGKPLTFKYGITEDISCTIEFTDELYHLFQLYLHEDVPFSCRLPLSSEPLLIEKGGSYIPFTFSFRGTLSESHIDIDHSMNVLITKPSNNNEDQFTFISAIAFGSGTNTTRTVIGDEVTLNFAVRWLDQLIPANSNQGSNLPFQDGFYKFPIAFIPISYSLFYTYILVTVFITSILVVIFSYRSISNKIKKHKYMPVDNESKQD